MRFIMIFCLGALSLLQCGFVHSGLGTFASEQDGLASEWLLGALLPRGFASDNPMDGGAGEDSTSGNTPGVLRVAAGNAHTCVLLSTGGVRCWGTNNSGQLGYGNTNTIGDNEMPVTAGDVSIGGTVAEIVAGLDHTCVLSDTGNVRCWGEGTLGRLGYGPTGNIGDNETPASVGEVDVGGTVVQIAAGQHHTCVLLDTGNVRCWGNGTLGPLGYGNTNIIGDNESPASAGDVNVGGTVVQIAAGDQHTCALLDTGNVRCWGRSDFGGLGYGPTGNIGDNETPASVGDVNVGGTVVQIDAGQHHTCALLDTGHVRCWGSGSVGRLGYGNENDIGDDETPASAGDVDVGGTVVRIAAGDAHNCALLSTGYLRCWGDGLSGNLGYGVAHRIGDDEAPAAAGDVDTGGQVTRFAAGGFHTCAVLNTGSVRCWGQGSSGVLGYGNTNNIGDGPGEMPPADVQVLDP